MVYQLAWIDSKIYLFVSQGKVTLVRIFFFKDENPRQKHQQRNKLIIRCPLVPKLARTLFWKWASLSPISLLKKKMGKQGKKNEDGEWIKKQVETKARICWISCGFYVLSRMVEPWLAVTVWGRDGWAEPSGADLQEAYPQRQGKKGPAVQSIYTYFFFISIVEKNLSPSHFLYLLFLRPPYTLWLPKTEA